VPIWSWVAGGVGLAFIGAGVGLLVDSRLAAERLDVCESYGEADLYACPTEDYEDLDAIEGDIARADIGLGVGVALLSVGAAGLAAGIVGLVVRTPEPTERQVTMVPLVNDEFAGLVVRGPL